MAGHLIKICKTLVATSLLAGALSACGFHLKGASSLPFANIYTNINDNTQFGARLQRTILANSADTKFVGDLQQADVYLHQISSTETRRELSLDADGRVEEYELRLQYSFELLDRDGKVLLPPTTLESLREIPYNPRIIQAKESEMARNFDDMRDQLIRQIINRISSEEVKNAYANSAERPSAEFYDELRQDMQQPGPYAPDTGPGADRIYR